MWAVYLFVWEDTWPDAAPFEETDGPRLLGQVRKRGAELGYAVTGLGDLGCDPGVQEVLGLDPDRFYSAAALYFDREEDARVVAAAFEPFTVGYGYVGIGCND